MLLRCGRLPLRRIRSNLISESRFTPWPTARMSVFSRRTTDEPAEEAARLLLRIGVFLLFVISLIAPILVRQTVYILLPIGAALLLASATLDAGRARQRSMRSILASPPLLAALLLAAWTGLSLFWTPFEGPAERFAKSAATLALVAAATAFSAAAHEDLKSQSAADRRGHRGRGARRDHAVHGAANIRSTTFSTSVRWAAPGSASPCSSGRRWARSPCAAAGFGRRARRGDDSSPAISRARPTPCPRSPAARSSSRPLSGGRVTWPSSWPR